LEGDALEIVSATRKEDGYPRKYGNIIEDVQKLLASFHSWSVRFVRREGNAVAHYLAQLAVTKKLNQEWFDKCPRGLSESVRKDLCKIHFPKTKKVTTHGDSK
jgi:hypothetical protein